MIQTLTQQITQRIQQLLGKHRTDQRQHHMQTRLNRPTRSSRDASLSLSLLCRNTKKRIVRRHWLAVRGRMMRITRRHSNKKHRCRHRDKVYRQSTKHSLCCSEHVEVLRVKQRRATMNATCSPVWVGSALCSDRKCCSQHHSRLPHLHTWSGWNIDDKWIRRTCFERGCSNDIRNRFHLSNTTTITNVSIPERWLESSLSHLSTLKINMSCHLFLFSNHPDREKILRG